MCVTVKLFYQFKADAAAAHRNCISDVDVSIVSLIKSQVIHLTWRLLDQQSTCFGLIPLNKMAVLIRIGRGSPSGWSKDRERCLPEILRGFLILVILRNQGVEAEKRGGLCGFQSVIEGNLNQIQVSCLQGHGKQRCREKQGSAVQTGERSH